jgi:hypothetical protein
MKLPKSDILSVTARRVFPSYATRIRNENEAMPNTIDIFNLPAYVPPPPPPVRPGANDHMNIRSIGGC